MGYGRGDSFPFYFEPNRFQFVSKSKGNCYHDHIPFNLKGNGTIVFSVWINHFCLAVSRCSHFLKTYYVEISCIYTCEEFWLLLTSFYMKRSSLDNWVKSFKVYLQKVVVFKVVLYEEIFVYWRGFTQKIAFLGTSMKLGTIILWVG